MSVMERIREERQRLYLRHINGYTCFIVLLIAVVLLTWLILPPTKPTFVLQEATVYDFSIAGRDGNFITTNIQITFAARNPNRLISIFYDRLNVYATYRSEQITLHSQLPESIHQSHKDVVTWSPLLNGKIMPVAPYLGEEITQNQNTMMPTMMPIMINFRIDARIRWKVGTFISSTYHLYANCPANLSFQGDYTPDSISVGSSILVGSDEKYKLLQTCHVDL